MNRFQKATLTASSFLTASLLLPLSAFAQPAVRPNGGNVNPCDVRTTGGPALDGFHPLCGLGNGDPASLIGFIVQVLLVAAVVISLIFLLWGGIKWITSGGDKGKLDTARNHIVAAIIGLIISLAAFFIINLVLQVFGLGSLSNLHLPKIISNG